MTWTTLPRSKPANMAYVQRGVGPHVLLIHGVGLRAEAWAAQIASLSSSYQVTACDLPGHGQSEALEIERPNLSDYTDAVAQLITEPTVVIGHSMGAMIAFECASHRNVIGVAALNAIFERTPQAHEAVRNRAETLSDTQSSDPTGTLQRWFSDLTTPEAQACEDWLGQVSPRAYKKAYTVFAAENGPSRDGLRQMTHPALFITGADEPNSTPDMSRTMANLCPNGQAIILEGAAHMMPMTHAQQVNDHLIEFIQTAHRR